MLNKVERPKSPPFDVSADKMLQDARMSAMTGRITALQRRAECPVRAVIRACRKTTFQAAQTTEIQGFESCW
jgi:hypothetical protein